MTNYITQNLPDNFKIWKFWNQLYECRDSYGSGKISFFLEDTNDVNYSNNIISDKLKTYFDGLNNENKKPEILKNVIFKAKVEPIFPELIKSYFENQIKRMKEPKFDVFISYSTKDINAAKRVGEILQSKGCSYFLAEERLTGGDIFSKEIRKALLNCREFCLIYSPNSKNSAWVTSEWGSAWTLGKKIVPILLDLTENDILEQHRRLKEFKYIKYREDEIADYAEKVFSRRFEYLFEFDRHYYYG